MEQEDVDFGALPSMKGMSLAPSQNLLLNSPVSGLTQCHLISEGDLVLTPSLLDAVT